MDINGKMVSVIIPVYNGERYIKRCIESILNQTYKNIEIIIVNDGSTDMTMDICSFYAENYNNVLLINQNNEGVTKARLNGVKKAIGNYISFIDCDDWVEIDYIKTMMEILNDSDIVLAGISRVLEEEDNRIVEERNSIEANVFYENNMDSFFKKALCYNLPFKAGILPYACNKIYKKNILLPIMDNVDKRINDGEDVAVIFPYLLASKKIVLSDYCGYMYLIHKGSGCNSKKEDAYNNAARLYVWLYENFKKSRYAETLLIQLRNYFLRMIWKRDPGAYLDTNEFVFPFNKIKSGSKIILYGAGDVGQAYFAQIKNISYCTVLAWADKNINYLDNIDIKFIKPNEILTYNFDYVVIAIRSEYTCNKVYEYLMHLGIPNDKIVLYDIRDI